MQYLLDIDAAAYVVDCDPNSDARGPDFVYNHSVALGRQMLSVRPNAVIIVVSGTKEGAVWLEGTGSQHALGNAAIRRAYADLTDEYPKAALHFVDGDEIYSQPDAKEVFWEMTVCKHEPAWMARVLALPSSS